MRNLNTQKTEVNTSESESHRHMADGSDANAKLLALFRDQEKYSAELWTVLQELRVWAALSGIELPSFAKPNRTFYHDRMEEVCARQAAIENFLRTSDAQSLEVH